MFGNMEEMQKEMKAKLAEMTVVGESGDGAVTVTANANREIINISLDPEKMDMEDKEQLEDLLMVATNRALELAATREQEEAQGMLKNILPGGLSGLGGMFGQ